MKIFGESVLLTRRFNRFDGDHDSDLGLVVDYLGVLHLYGDADGVRLYQLTSDPDYIAWLLRNSMDLLSICPLHCPNVWYPGLECHEILRSDFVSALENLYEDNY